MYQRLCCCHQFFYERYADNTEILAKKNRPYLVLLVEYRSLKFAIPA